MASVGGGEENKQRRDFWPRWFWIFAAAAMIVTAIALPGEAFNRPLRYYTDGNGTALTYYTSLNNDSSVSAWGINTDNPTCELDINGTVCINRTGVFYNGVNISGGGASSSASYVTMSTEPGLSDERVLTPGKGITITDTGAGGVARINITDLNTCSGTDASQYNGTGWACVASGGADGNNRVLSAAFTINGANYVLNLQLNNTNNVSAFFTLVTERGINITNGTIYVNGTACGAGEYSRFDGYGFSCYTDSSGSFNYGTYFDQYLNTTSDVAFSSVNVSGAVLPTANNTYSLGANNTVWKDVWLGNSSVYIGQLQLSSNAPGSVLYVNGVAVASYSDIAAFYVNVTDLQTSNTSTNARIDSLNSSKGNVSSTNGSSNYVAVFDSSTGLRTGSIFDNGSNVTILGTSLYIQRNSAAAPLLILERTAGNGIAFQASSGGQSATKIVTTTGQDSVKIYTGATGNISNGDFQLDTDLRATQNLMVGGGNTLLRSHDSTLDVIGDAKIMDDYSGGWTDRAQLDIVETGGQAAIGLIRSNSSYFTITSPGGVPTATRAYHGTSLVQAWVGGNLAGTTVGAGDVYFGSSDSLPVLFVDADRRGVGVNTNGTWENFTVTGNVSFKTGSNSTYFYASDANGRIGINTSAPINTLTVVGGASFSDRVGVNTTQPDRALSVVGDVGINTSSNRGGLNITNTFAGRAVSLQINRPGSGSLIFTTTGGTPSSTQIGVASSSGTQAFPINLYSATSGDYVLGDATIGAGGGTTQPTSFFSTSSDQQVGFNTSSPNATLHVVGNTLVTENMTAGGLLVGAGGSSAPSMSFSGDPDTGIYNGASNQVYVVGGGVNVLTLSSSGLFNHRFGSAASPSYSFQTDGNAGFYLVRPDQWGYSTGGVHMLNLTNLSVEFYNGSVVVHANGTLNASTVTTPQICLNGDCKTAWPTGGSGTFDGFGVNSGGTNASIANSTTLHLYGSGITINGSTASPNPGFTFTASAGGGNVSGGSINGTLGCLAMWNSTTTITNSSLCGATSGTFVFPRNIQIADYGSDGSVLFNGGNAGGIYWVRASDRIRYACNAAGTGTCEFFGNSMYFAGGNDPSLSLYSDTVNRSLSVTNTGSEEAWFDVDDKVTVNGTTDANSKTFTVIGEANITGRIFSTDTINTTQGLQLGDGDSGGSSIIGDCITFSSGGRVCSNSTATYLVSPDGGTTVEAAN